MEAYVCAGATGWIKEYTRGGGGGGGYHNYL